jgi:transcriptional regulator with GAF, ATPase, and Fis domain
MKSDGVAVKIFQHKYRRGEDFRYLEQDRMLAASQRSNRNISGLGPAAKLLGLNLNKLASRMRSQRIKGHLR